MAGELIQGHTGAVLVGGLVAGKDSQGGVTGEEGFGPIIDAQDLHVTDSVILETVDATLAERNLSVRQFAAKVSPDSGAVSKIKRLTFNPWFIEPWADILELKGEPRAVYQARVVGICSRLRLLPGRIVGKTVEPISTATRVVAIGDEVRRWWHWIVSKETLDRRIGPQGYVRLSFLGHAPSEEITMRCIRHCFVTPCLVMLAGITGVVAQDLPDDGSTQVNILGTTAPASIIGGRVIIGNGEVWAGNLLRSGEGVELSAGGEIRMPGYDSDAGIAINYVGYNRGTSRCRSLSIYDGKQNPIAVFDGPTRRLKVTGVAPESAESNAVLMGGGTLRAANLVEAGDLEARGNVRCGGGIELFSGGEIRMPGYDSDAGIAINYVGYNRGTTRFRSLSIYDGKQNPIAVFEGPTRRLKVTGVAPDSAESNAVLIGGGTLRAGNLIEAGDLEARGAIKAGGNIRSDGTIYAREVKVRADPLLAPDYVFADDYKLRPLAEVEKSVKANRHLPGIPSAAEMGRDGLGVSETMNKHLEKIEELTLYAIDADKRIKAMLSERDAARAEVDALKQRMERLEKAILAR